MPWTAWLLIGASILPGIVLVLAFYIAHGADDVPSDAGTEGDRA